MIGRQHHCHVARKVRLRAQRIHLLASGRARNHLHTDSGHVLAGKGLNEILLVKGIEIGHMNAARLQLADFLDVWLTQPKDHVSSGHRGTAIRTNTGSGRLVVRVADAGTHACTRFDDHLRAKPHQLFYCLWRRRDAILSRLGFTGYD